MTSYGQLNQHQLAAIMNQRMTLQHQRMPANQRLQNPQQLPAQQPRMQIKFSNPQVAMATNLQGNPLNQPPLQQRQVNPPPPRMTVTPPQQQIVRNMVATQQSGQQLAPQRKLPTVKQELEAKKRQQAINAAQTKVKAEKQESKSHMATPSGNKNAPKIKTEPQVQQQTRFLTAAQARYTPSPNRAAAKQQIQQQKNPHQQNPMATPPNTRPQQLPPQRPQYHPPTSQKPPQIPAQIPTSQKSQFPGIPNPLLQQGFFLQQGLQQAGLQQQEINKQLQQAAQQAAAQQAAAGFPQMYNIGQIAAQTDPRLLSMLHHQAAIQQQQLQGLTPRPQGIPHPYADPFHQQILAHMMHQQQRHPLVAPPQSSKTPPKPEPAPPQSSKTPPKNDPSRNHAATAWRCQGAETPSSGHESGEIFGSNQE